MSSDKRLCWVNLIVEVGAQHLFPLGGILKRLDAAALFIASSSFLLSKVNFFPQTFVPLS